MATEEMVRQLLGATGLRAAEAIKAAAGRGAEEERGTGELAMDPILARLERDPRQGGRRA